MLRDTYQKNLVLFFGLRFFTSLTLGLYFSFGSLLIYNQSHSVLLAILFNLINYLGLVSLNSILLPITLKVVNSLGPKLCMVSGLLLLAISYLALFKLQASSGYYVMSLILVALLNALGSNLYYILSNTTYYLVIGNSNRPGTFSALFSTSSTIAGIIAGIIGLMFARLQVVEYIFSVQAFLLVVAVIALTLMQLPRPSYHIEFPKYLKKLSLFEHLAAMELNHELITTVVPLIVFLKLGSLNKSFFVSGIVSLGTVLVVNIAGYFKDRNNNAFIYIAALVGILGWLAYFFIRTPFGFVIVGIITGISYRIIGTIFDGRLGRKFRNSGAGLEMQLAFNFSQIWGRIFILIGSFFVYALTKDIKASVLGVGALLLLPKVIFVLKNIDSKVLVDESEDSSRILT